MKRASFWLLAMLCVCVACCAQAAPGDTILFGETAELHPSSGAVVGDTLYLIVGQRNLYTYHVGDEAAELLLDEQGLGLRGSGTDILLIGGDSLTLIRKADGVLGTLEDGGVRWHVRLDFEGLNTNAGDELLGPDVSCPVWEGDSLLLLYREPWASVEQHALLRFDARTGKREALPTENVIQIAPCQPGELLALVANTPAAGQWQPSRPNPVLLDAATGEVLRRFPLLPTESDGAIAWDAAAQALYAVSNRQLLRLVEDQWTVQTSVAISYALSASYAVLLPSGHYVAITSDHSVVVRNIDPQHAVSPLLIHGYVDSRLLDAFAREHPEIPVTVDTPTDYSSDTVPMLLRTGDDHYDLFAVTQTLQVQALLDKGYPADLSGSDILTREVASMYAPVQDAVLREGRLLAYPLEMDVTMWGVNDAGLEEYGIGAFPATLGKMLDVLQAWEEESDSVALLAPVLSWQARDDLRSTFLTYVLEQYVRTYDVPGQPLSFDTLEFREMLAKASNLPTRPNTSDSFAGNCLLNMNYVWLGGQSDGQWPPMRAVAAPPFAADVSAKTPASLTLALLNPYSRHPEQAMILLEYLATHVNDEQRILMRPDENQPVASEYDQQSVLEQRAIIAEVNELLKTAPKVDQKRLEGYREEAERILAVSERSQWIIAPERIAEYRKLAPTLDFVEHPLLFADLDQPLTAYADGRLSLDQLIAELDKRARMAQMEGE